MAGVKQRVDVVDIMKGVAITLVVLGHTGQGMAHRGWWTGPGYGRTDSFIYSFHMPAFLFVAGLFVAQSIHRHGSARFVLDKLRVVLYPYLLWAIIGQITAPWSAGWRSGGTSTWPELWHQMMHDDANWFLITLFICLMIALLTRRLPAWQRLLGAVAVCMVAPHTGWTLIDRPVSEISFLAAGMWTSVRLKRLNAVQPGAALLGAAALFALQAVEVWRAAPIPTAIEMIFFGLQGTLALALFCRALVAAPTLGVPMLLAGQASLAVYVMSSYWQGLGRLLLSSMHCIALWPQLLLPTAFAVAAPALLWHLQRRVPAIGWLFQIPRRKTA